jgi:hypothetical protein
MHYQLVFFIFMNPFLSACICAKFFFSYARIRIPS